MLIKKAVHKLNSNKIDEGGMLFYTNIIHRTDLLYCTCIYNI